MGVHSHIEQRGCLVPVQVVERILVYVEKIPRTRAQRPVLGESAMGDGDDRTVIGRNRLRQVAIVVIAVP